MIGFYLDHVFLITITVMGLVVSTLLLGPLILHMTGQSLEDRPDIKNLLMDIAVGLIYAGLLIPLVLAFIIKIKPNFIEELTSYKSYLLGILLIGLAFTNFRRFKLIAAKKSLSPKLNNSSVKLKSEMGLLDEKINSYRSDMILIGIFIAYTALLFS
ncbi:hypothetical protein [Psychrobacter sanguinis]|uniref:DUF4149 domain-containing protein n=1 Tax=Psychrobacter sanguinis TaxID=861445 RepID=A0A844LZZ4_9GAMM|nr:hypothetical protein [Psychrobacter sanguinis]MUG32093.1 hypothetical protein [Psychrobacter sanguinis]